MPKKRTELPPNLVAEWADDRTIKEVLATPGKLGGGVMAKVKWRCRVKGCGREWVARLKKRLTGNGCASCAKRGIRKGEWRNHPDFHLIAHHTPQNATLSTKISISCSKGCGKPYSSTIASWLSGNRQHHACAVALRRRINWQQPPGFECLESQTAATYNTYLRWRHSCGYEFETRLGSLDHAVRRGTSGCPRCSGKAPLSIRFREEAPDLLQHLTTPPKALAVLAAIGADKGALGVAYRNALHLTQKGVSAIEAVRRVAKEMDEDGTDADDTTDVPLLPAGKATPAKPSTTTPHTNLQKKNQPHHRAQKK
jgi:hypothetical protein